MTTDNTEGALRATTKPATSKSSIASRRAGAASDLGGAAVLGRIAPRLRMRASFHDFGGLRAERVLGGSRRASFLLLESVRRRAANSCCRRRASETMAAPERMLQFVGALGGPDAQVADVVPDNARARCAAKLCQLDVGHSTCAPAMASHGALFPDAAAGCARSDVLSDRAHRLRAHCR